MFTLCSTATVADCVLYHIKTKTTVVVSLYSDNGLDFYMYLDGLYCCATVWLLMGGKLCSKCVFLFVCTVNGSKAESSGRTDLKLCSADNHSITYMSYTELKRLMFHCCGRTHTQTHTHNPGGDLCVQTVFKRNC